jgi:hypothetical protein
MIHRYSAAMRKDTKKIRDGRAMRKSELKVIFEFDLFLPKRH